MTFDADRFLDSVSNAPGVYRMLDDQGRHLYVGKARRLKARLSSYFKGSAQSPKTTAMLRHVDDVQVTVTRHESEALLLENNLIKEHRPRYNVVLRDDKSYPYIHLESAHEFPRIGFYRGNRKAPGRYFGPYPSAGAVRETLSQLQKVFPVRQCEDTFFRNRSRPCLQYQIKRCTAPCVGLVDKSDYDEDVEQAVDFLDGKDGTLVDRLTRQMETAAENLEYERAALFRDRIRTLNRVLQTQYVDGDGGDADVIAIEIADGEACIEVVFVRMGRNIGSKKFILPTSLTDDAGSLLSAFLPQYYLGKPIPSEILLKNSPEDRELLEQTFSEQSERKIAIRDRIRGQRARWLDMAYLNAADGLRRHQAGRASRAKRVEQLQDALGLDQAPERIECFDVSHTMGELTVTSCVVFDADGPVKSAYRRFNIDGITPGDDYAAMSQALTRRYKRIKAGEGQLPDLLLIDGGKGQVSAARQVLEELQVTGVRLVGVAKGTTRKPGLERLIGADGKTAALAPDSPALHLIQEIRDEAHRFAITGHRQRRAKARVTSTLESIPGIGDKRRQTLLKAFGGLRGLSRAGVEDLARVPGISPKLAQRIYAEFHDTSD